VADRRGGVGSKVRQRRERGERRNESEKGFERRDRDGRERKTGVDK
jgi:hypothetical protein